MPEDPSEPFSCEVLVAEENWSKKIAEPQAFCARIVKHALAGFEGPFGEIDLLLCNNKKMQELNNVWRKIDKPTNVLSFSQIGNDAIRGSIALGYEICETEAKMQNKTFENHVTHLLIHGVLHLMGYDHIDENEAVEMESLETEILAQIGIDNPYLECLETWRLS